MSAIDLKVVTIANSTKRIVRLSYCNWNVQLVDGV